MLRISRTSFRESVTISHCNRRSVMSQIAATEAPPATTSYSSCRSVHHQECCSAVLLCFFLTPWISYSFRRHAANAAALKLLNPLHGDQIQNTVSPYQTDPRYQQKRFVLLMVCLNKVIVKQLFSPTLTFQESNDLTTAKSQTLGPRIYCAMAGNLGFTSWLMCLISQCCWMKTMDLRSA